MILIFLVLFLTQINIITPSDVQFGNTYDAHPWVYGQKVKPENAKAICRNTKKRLCNVHDLNVLYKQKRGFCIKAWAYNTPAQSVLGHVISVETKKCLNQSDFIGVKPESIIKHETFMKFWCLFDSNEAENGYECSGNGEDYRGTVGKTRNGEICQDWYMDTPNKHIYNPATNKEFRASGLEKNFCRNPNGRNKPWCYYSNKKGWNYCNIKCAPYGDFEPCNLKMYTEKNYRGYFCNVTIDKQMNALVVDPYRHSKCHKRFFKNITSLKLRGRFCHIFLYQTDFHDKDRPRKSMYHLYGTGNHSDLHGFKVGSIYLFDHSAEVMNTFYFIEHVIPISTESSAKYAFYKNLRECTAKEVDRSNFIYYLYDSIQTGYIKERGHLINYFKFKTNDKELKKTWCCLNENPSLSYTYTNKYDAKRICTLYKRKDYGYYRGKRIVITHRRRLCSWLDIMHHFDYNNLYHQNGWIDNKINVVGSKHAGTTYARPWCCDEDCLPLFRPCRSDEQCCSEHCVQYKCHDIFFPDIEDENESHFKSKYWWVYLLILLYTFGWIMRCCCPKRQIRPGNIVKID